MENAYVQINKSVLYNSELTSDEKVALFALMDRLSLSKTKGDMFKQDGQYFVSYSQETMAKVINKSVHTVSSVYKRLEAKGMIKRKKRFNATDVIFLPLSSKIEGMYMQKLHTSKHNFNKHNTSNTVNTDSRPKKQSISKEELWKQSVIGKIGFTESTVENIYEFANHDLNRCYQLVKIITNARNSVVRENNLKRSNATDFKTNATIRQRLATKLRYVFNYLPAQIDEQSKYLTKSLKNFFTETLGIKRDEFTAPELKSTQQPRINNEIPEWMKEEYDSSNDFSAEKQARIKEKMMRKLKNIDDKLQDSQPMRPELEQRKTCTLAEHLANNAVMGS